MPLGEDTAGGAVQVFYEISRLTQDQRQEKEAEGWRDNACSVRWLAHVWNESVGTCWYLSFFISVVFIHGFLEDLQVTLGDFCELYTHT